MPIHALTGPVPRDGRRALVRAQPTSEEPVAAAEGKWLYLVLDPAVVHGELPVMGEPFQRFPAQQLCYTLALLSLRMLSGIAVSFFP